MSRSHTDYLNDALYHIAKIEAYMTRETFDDALLDAISHRLEAMIDCLSKLGADECEKLFGAEWRFMKGMRNRIAHAYLEIDHDVVITTVKEELPDIKRTIEVALL